MPKGHSVRKELAPIAERMRAEGFLFREIASLLDVGLSTVGAWIHDPDRERELARKRRYGGTCIDCGVPTDGSRGPGKGAQRCSSCLIVFNKRRAEEIRPERFWAKVDKDGPLLSLHLGPCWLWTGFTDPHGYGRFVWDGGQLAHRFAYELFNGTIPDGLQLDHLCRVHACVNPAHLEAVTNWENKRRGNGFTAKNARKTHCIRGHLLAGENLQPRAKGRRCRLCEKERYQERKRA